MTLGSARCDICGWDEFMLRVYKVGDEYVCAACDVLSGYPSAAVDGRQPNLLSGSRLRRHLTENMPFVLDEWHGRLRQYAAETKTPYDAREMQRWRILAQ